MQIPTRSKINKTVWCQSCVPWLDEEIALGPGIMIMNFQLMIAHKIRWVIHANSIYLSVHEFRKV